MSVKTQVVKAVRWTAAGRVASQVVTWGITLYVIRILSPEDYGLMSMAMALIGFCLLVNELGVVPAFIQVKEIDVYRTRQVFGLVLVFNFTGVVLLIVGAPYYEAFFGEERLVEILWVLSIALVALALGSVPSALLMREIEFKLVSIIDFNANIFSALITLGLAIYGMGVWALVAGSVTLAVIRAGGMLIVTRFWLLPVFRFDGMGEMIWFGAKISAQKILWYFGSQLDVILIGKLLGKSPLGIYSVGHHLDSMPMHKVMGIVNQIAFPAYSRLQDDMPRVCSYFLQTSGLFCLVYFPVMWGLSSVAPELVAVFLGETWQGATIVLQILCLAIPFRLCLNLWPALIGAIGRPGLNLTNMVIELVIMACCIATGVTWGIQGAAVGAGIVYVTAWAVISIRCLPLIGATRLSQVITMVPAMLCSGAMYAAVYGARLALPEGLPNSVRLGLLVVAGAAVYGGLAFTFNRDTLKQAIALLTSRQ